MSLNSESTGTTGPGVDRGNTSLEDLGLVDPSSGRALSTADWSPAGTPAPGGLRDWDEGSPSASPSPSSTPDTGWDSDANPYKAEAERLRGETPDPTQQAQSQLQTRTREIDSQAQAAFAQLIGTGMPAEQAQLLVGAAKVAANAEAQMQADRLALLPAAKRAVSEKIAKEFSMPNARIDPTEILSESSVDGMRARAKTLQETRRGQAYTARRVSGADRVERGAAPGTKVNYDDLSITDTIKLGILRNQFTP